MKYLSKLLSMLLIGSMLCTVGCKKYDDDIKSLNNRVDKIEGSLNDQISPMKTDLDAVKTQLEKLVSDTESLTATHKSDLATLTKANEDLAKRIKALEDGDYAKKIADAAKVPTYGYDIHQYQSDDENTYLIFDDKKIKVQIFGEHNMKNINAAYNVCKQLGITDEVFYNAISTFKGASRRLELMFGNKEKNNLVFRDFAHAPSKVLATVKALREQYPEIAEQFTKSSVSRRFTLR